MAVLGSLGALAVVPPGVVVALVVTLLWAWVRTWRRRAAIARRAPPGEDELLRLYDRVQRRLGRRRAPPETPLEYNHGPLPNALPFGERELLDDLTVLVNEGAYAGRWPDPGRVRELSKRLS
jgi:hypothetical protein